MQEQGNPADQHHQGLYRPEFEHDACGIGALANLHGQKSHQILDDALSVLVNLEHRGGTGLEKNTGDGAASSSRCRIIFSAKKHRSAVTFCPPRAITALPCSFSRRTSAVLRRAPCL